MDEVKAAASRGGVGRGSLLLFLVAVGCSSPAESTPPSDDAATNEEGTDASSDTPPSDAAIDTEAEAAVAAKALDVVVGDFYACALLDDGKVYCWGDVGNIGDGALDKPLRKPTSVALTRTPKALTSGRFHVCASDMSKTLECWGSNTWGQLGATPSGLPLGPRTIDFSGPIRVASAAATFTCALLDSGKIECLGNDDQLQLGAARPSDCTLVASGKKFPCSTTPIEVPLATTADRLGSNSESSVARLTDGTVRTWGGGDGPISVAVPDAKDVVAPNCVIRSDGALWCWTPPSLTAAAVAGAPADIVEAGNGGSPFSCARTKSSEVWCWGANDRGQLGDGTKTPRTMPLKIDGFAATRIAVGGDTTCAITATGDVFCWGRGTEYQLGNNYPHDSATPVKVVW